MRHSIDILKSDRNKNKKRPLIGINIHNKNDIIEFESVRSTIRYLHDIVGLSSANSTLCRALNNQRVYQTDIYNKKYVGGYYWYYKDEYKNMP